MRLLGAAIVLEEEDGKLLTLSNTPSQPEGYREFRRRVLHLSALHVTNQLTVRSIAYEQPWPHSPDRGLDPQELTAALEHGYRWIVMGKGSAFDFIAWVPYRLWPWLARFASNTRERIIM